MGSGSEKVIVERTHQYNYQTSLNKYLINAFYSSSEA